MTQQRSPQRESIFSLYPLWLLFLAGLNLLALLPSVFFLFGGIGQGFLGYLLVQLYWIAPLAAFFLSLRAHDRGYPVIAALVALAGIGVLAASVFVLL